jgi:hypothetical protein
MPQLRRAALPIEGSITNIDITRKNEIAESPPVPEIGPAAIR